MYAYDRDYKRYMHHCMFTFISICMYMYGNCTNVQWLLCGILVHVTMYNLNHIILLVIFISCFIAVEAHVLFVAKYHIIFSPRNVEIRLLIAVTFEFVHD